MSHRKKHLSVLDKKNPISLHDKHRPRAYLDRSTLLCSLKSFLGCHYILNKCKRPRIDIALGGHMCAWARACTCVRACVHACVRACVRACVCVCVFYLLLVTDYHSPEGWRIAFVESGVMLMVSGSRWTHNFPLASHNTITKPPNFLQLD